MPRKTKYTKSKKTYKKKAYKKKRSAVSVHPKKELQVLNPPLFPVKKFARLNYYDVNVGIGGVGGLIGAVAYSANGLFDPQIAVGGHQPVGFDQMMLIYNHYTVTKSTATVTFTNTKAYPIMCAIWLSADGVLTTDPIQMNENGMLVKAVLNPVGVAGATKTLTLTTDIGKVNGIKSPLNEFAMRGDAANNPLEQSYYLFGCWTNFSTNDAAVAISMLIEYDAWFTEPRKLITS